MGADECTPGEGGELPLAAEGCRGERRGGRPNRVFVLEAAARLFAEHGFDGVSMDDIAAVTGVGKGTLHRGFRDKSALVFSILDERERQLRAAVLGGPPPLGPGAPAGERLVALLHALVEQLEGNEEMLLIAENSALGARYRSGAYAAWRRHVSGLLREARPELDSDWHADALLAPLAAELYRHQREELGGTPARTKDGLERIARALLGSGPSPR